MTQKLGIEVDGGINLATCEEVKKAGAEVLVSGTAILMAKDFGEIISELKKNIKFSTTTIDIQLN